MAKLIKKHKQQGNALFFILIAVVLFAALSYVITSSQRSSPSIAKEQAILNKGLADNFVAMVNAGAQLLESRGCVSIDYTPPAEQSASGDKSCFVFHANGAGVTYQDIGFNSCTLAGGSLTTLAVGQLCGNIIYGGSLSGQRLYVLNTDFGSYKWSNAASSAISTSNTDGTANTTSLVAATGYPAASACRALGSKWYLPSHGEFQAVRPNFTTGAFTTLFPTNTNFWTSTLQSTVYAYFMTPPSANNGYTNLTWASPHVACFTKG